MKGFDRIKALDNAEEPSYYDQLDQLLGLAFVPL